MNSPVVFSHNDLQGGNILCRHISQKDEENETKSNNSRAWEERLTVIDFEFCSYNFRAFDIANHWTEWMYDYGLDESPYYTKNLEKYPNKEDQVCYFKRIGLFIL